MQEGQYKFKLNNFEGPLDLLYHLIEKNKMNIYDISLNEITDQYMEYINSMEKLNLEVTGDFLVMASNLLYIKSKILLPSQKNEDEDDPREELVNKLIEYKKIKEAVEFMRKSNREYSKLHYKFPEKLTFEKEIKLEKEYSSDIIPSIFMRIAQLNMDKINHSAKDINRLMDKEKVTVKSKIREILKKLSKQKDFIFGIFFSSKEKSKNEIVTAFLAMLELNKANRITIEQKYTFADIKIKKSL